MLLQICFCSWSGISIHLPIDSHNAFVTLYSCLQNIYPHLHTILVLNRLNQQEVVTFWVKIFHCALTYRSCQFTLHKQPDGYTTLSSLPFSFVSLSDTNNQSDTNFVVFGQYFEDLAEKGKY